MTLRVFTHPACSECGPAVEMAWNLSESQEHLVLETVKLENKEGLSKAQNIGIKTIPTLIFYKGENELKRIIGLPEEDQLKKEFLELNQ
ncbi:MAG: thioredoxin domain-containing protein [Candidatus Marinimicrobia bacterium]|jgi:predicted DsbA family dithiol-disulfide isomerase|nr:thioredoxin domain-containing protein [Candidatus Neomarinimicrobiota bacterium]|tara:strand:+ start:815 stop:1081 length:267 start_codon:yes stop_codon:yes gene_type:complete